MTTPVAICGSRDLLDGTPVATNGDRDEHEEDPGDPSQALNNVGGGRRTEGERACRRSSDRDGLMLSKRLQPTRHGRDGHEGRRREDEWGHNGKGCRLCGFGVAEP